MESKARPYKLQHLQENINMRRYLLLTPTMSNSSTLPNPNVYLNYLSPENAHTWELVRNVYLLTCGVSFYLLGDATPVRLMIGICVGINMGHPIFYSKGSKVIPAIQRRSHSVRALQVCHQATCRPKNFQTFADLQLLDSSWLPYSLGVSLCGMCFYKF